MAHTTHISRDDLNCVNDPRDAKEKEELGVEGELVHCVRGHSTT